MPRKAQRTADVKTTMEALASRVSALERDVNLLTLGDQLRQALRRIAALEAEK